MVIYSRTNISVSVIDIQRDLCNIPQNWTAHFNTLHYEGSWTVLPLRTPGGTDNILPDLTNNDHFEDHPNMMLFPYIKSFIEEMKCELMSIRLLRLAAGSVIKQHRDMELAFEKGEARLHIPIKTNAGVEFYIQNERVIMNEGECWYMNANLPHRVTNNGNTDRIHLVIDCKVNPWLEKLILNTDMIAHAPDEKYDPEVLKQMIISLKVQGTEQALQMAMKLQFEYNTLVNA